MGSLKGKAEWMAEIQDRGLTLPQIFELFPSVRVPFGELILMLGRIAPRYYTIASSSKVNPQQIELVISLSNTVDRLGMISGILAEAEKTGSLPTFCGFIKDSTFELSEGTTPLLMIATGSGIAPFRGILQDLALAPITRDIVLLFGIRTVDIDFLFKDDFEKIAAKCDLELMGLHDFPNDPETPVISQFFLALSRQPPNIHVQDLLQGELEHFQNLVATGTTMVCGGVAMGKDIREFVKNCGDYEEMIDNKRYCEELWG